MALFVGAILSFPVYLFLDNWFELEFESVANRVVVLSAFILIFIAIRKLGIMSWQEIGYDANKNDFFKNLLIGFAFGALIMLQVVVGLLLTKNRVIDLDWSWSLTSILPLLLTALIAGLLISIVEETLIRGAMFTAIQKQSSVLLAVVSTSFIYAFTHFLNPEIQIGDDEISWLSGLILLNSAFIPFLSPENIFDSFIALFLAGTLLGIIKARTNKLAICIGIHAGWVFIIKVFKQITNHNFDSEFALLTGSYDNVTGYLAAICISIAIVFVLRSKKTQMQSSRH